MKKELRREAIRDDRFYKGKRIERWRAYFEFYDENGELQRHRPSFATEKKAKKKIKEFEQEETLNRKFIKPDEKIRFKDYCERYAIPEMLERLSRTSHVGEKARIQAAIDFFGNATIESITRIRIEDYKKYLEAKTANGKDTTLSHKTVNRYLQRLRAVLNEAQAKFTELPVVNLKKGVFKSERNQSRKRTVDFMQFDAILNACTGRQDYLRL